MAALPKMGSASLDSEIKTLSPNRPFPQLTNELRLARWLHRRKRCAAEAARFLVLKAD
jgi:hypothetical protein